MSLRETKVSNLAPLRIGDWRVDPAIDEISRDGTVVKLEPLSMRLLLYLAQRAGQVVPVEDLLNDLWGGVIVTADSVYQAVAGLRRTLGDNSKNPKYIATLTRRGYRLVAEIAPYSDTAMLLLSTLQPISPAETLAVIPQPSSIRKSIAVLPFTDMSEKKDQEYFGDGMAEEILDLLIKIPGLAVIGRTSSFQFKGKSEDLRAIGTRLNAAYILEGSVRKSGERVRVTAQLVDTRDGIHIWSEKYDRDVDDVLKLQDAIAAAVVRRLQLTVASRHLQPRATVKNKDAYDLMLRGRHAADRWDREGLDEAVALLQQALDRDPTSADAVSQLAFAYLSQGEEGFVISTTAFEHARREAATALNLDPTNLLAHYVLGVIHVVYDWDWGAAESEFHHVATLAPGSGDAMVGQAMLCLAFGRLNDALRQLKTSLAQDPLDAGTLVVLSWVQARCGHLSEAEAAIRRALDIRPTYSWGRYYLSLILLAHGDPDAAMAEMRQETDELVRQAGMTMVYHALGRQADADAALAGMLKDQADANAFGIAETYAFRGQSDEAMHWLERAYAQKDPGLYYVKGDPPLRSIAADPRFKALLRKMNLPE
jgi:TolB-like protein/Flp pilus assembly protein TadD